MFFGQFYENWVSVREKNLKLLLGTVTYKAITETVPCIITIETVMSIMHCRKSHLPNYNKNCHPYICCRNCHLHQLCRASNCIIATETVICIIATEISCI